MPDAVRQFFEEAGVLDAVPWDGRPAEPPRAPYLQPRAGARDGAGPGAGGAAEPGAQAAEAVWRELLAGERDLGEDGGGASGGAAAGAGGAGGRGDAAGAQRAGGAAGRRRILAEPPGEERESSMNMGADDEHFPGVRHRVRLQPPNLCAPLVDPRVHCSSCQGLASKNSKSQGCPLKAVRAVMRQTHADAAP
jgi:hypothetical protein